MIRDIFPSRIPGVILVPGHRWGPNSLKTMEFIYVWNNPFASQFLDRLADWEGV